MPYSLYADDILVVPVNGNNLFNGSTWVHFDSSSNVLNGAGFGGLH